MEKIIKQPELIKALGISRGTLFNMRKEGKIPAPRKISSRCVGWLQSDIDKWLQSRPIVERFSGLHG